MSDHTCDKPAALVTGGAKRLGRAFIEAESSSQTPQTSRALEGVDAYSDASHGACVSASSGSVGSRY